MEHWRTIPDTKGMLEVSDAGRVRSNLRDGRILKDAVSNKGYHKVRVTLERVKRTFTVHREVAKAFIPNPNGYEQVNHIDGNKDNNRAENLEWCTNTQNCKHAIENGLWENVFSASRSVNESRKTPIQSKDAVTGEIRTFESVSEAERFFNTRHISDVLKGKREKAAGQYFERIERG